jgi:CheY-like chemotaxis protein
VLEPMVFVVSADAGARKTLARALHRRLGVRAVSMGGGEATLACARSAPPALVVTDLSMPGMDGYTLARRLREQPETRAVPVVGLSGAGPDQRDRARAAGCVGFVAPAQAAEIARVVRTCIEEGPGSRPPEPA